MLTHPWTPLYGVVLCLLVAFERFCKGGIVGISMARASRRHLVQRHIPLAQPLADDKDQVILGRFGP